MLIWGVMFTKIIFNRHSMSPYDSPAPYNLLQYTEIAEGIWYPRGGFHKVVEKLEKIAIEKFGAKFIYNTGIEKIIVDENKVAKGIRLENGEEKYADIVVCNAGKFGSSKFQI